MRSSSYHSGYEKPLSLKGARFLCACLSYLGGWRSPIGEVMDTVGHTGDEEEHCSFEERFDHTILSSPSAAATIRWQKMFRMRVNSDAVGQ